MVEEKKKKKKDKKILVKDRQGRLRKFVMADDPFVNYVLEDVWIRARIGKGAVRCRAYDDETLELIAMDNEALERVLKILQSGEFRLKIASLRRPTPEEIEQWLESHKDYPMLPGLGDEDEE